MGAGLNDKQKRFCEEYLIDLNASQAAIRAGYSERTAPQQAARLLTNVNVQTYLQERQQQLQKKTGITQERVLEEYSKIAFSDIRKFYTIDGALKSIHDLDDDAAAALAGVEVDDIWEGSGEDKEIIGQTKKIKIYDKVRALDSLGRHLGIFGKDNDQSRPVVQITGMKVS